MSELDTCRRQIKEWEKTFAAETGRPPSRSDIKANGDIHKAYKRYRLLKSEAQKAELKPSERITNDFVDIVLTDDSDVEPVEPALNAELGPTPQANGKVLSLFDNLPSPPESSPLKNRGSLLGLRHVEFGIVPSLEIGRLPVKGLLLLPKKDTDDFEFKTPTKPAKALTLSNVTPLRSSATLSSRLHNAALPGTPKDIVGAETPQYLGEINSRFSFNYSSPSKPGGEGNVSVENSPSKALLRTPTKPSVTFQVSPSPLKSQRMFLFGGTKRVSALFTELQGIIKNETYEAERLAIEQELRENEESEKDEEPEDEQMAKRRRKAKTQKRTRRRHKMKPLLSAAEGDAFEGKDVHAEIEKLKSVNHMEGEESSETEDDEELPVVTRKAPSTKFTPVSKNFKRLKINDPRSKRFRKHMKRR